MSIIHSALQKAQIEQQKQTIPPVPAESFVKASALLEKEQQIAIQERARQTHYLHRPYSETYQSSLWRRADVAVMLMLACVLGNVYMVNGVLSVVHSVRPHEMVSFSQTNRVEKGEASSSASVQPASFPSVVQLGTSSVLGFANAVPRQPHEFVCTGVIYDGAESVAIVNRALVSVGDVVKGALVEEINSESVTLTYNGKKVVLTITASQ